MLNVTENEKKITDQQYSNNLATAAAAVILWFFANLRF